MALDAQLHRRDRLGRDRPRSPAPDAAVTDILGSILLVAVTVVFAAGFMFLLLSLPPPTPPTDAVLETFVLPTNNDRVVIEHRGGSPIPLNVLGVTVEIDGVPTRVTVGERLAAQDAAWSVVTPSGVSKNAGADLVAGDQVRFTDSTLPGKAVSILVLQTSTGAVVLSGATAQQSDTTAPQIQSARTTSTTTIQVNFTEPLRTIDKADFTVTLPTLTISTMTLLGNGSAAEITTSTTFTTSDTPTVSRIGSPTGTRDVADNLLAGTSSVVATDGVAPTISSVSSGSPGQTSATITFTTSETASSNVTFGPTPALTGRWVTGTSTTSHSLSLTSLTAGTQYHYKVTAVDAAGNNNTGEAFATFSTTAISGGGGGGGSAPNYLQFNATQTTVARGTASGSFTVTLLNGTGTATAPSADLYVTLLTNSTNGYFVNDTDGSTRIAGVVIPTTTPSQNFKFISYDGGSHPVIVAAANNTVAAAHQIAVTGTNPSPPFIQPPSHYLNFSTAPASVARDTASTNFTITLKNTTGSTVSAESEILVTLATNSTVGTFLNGTDGTTKITHARIGPGSSAADFKYLDRSAGNQPVIMAFAPNTTAAAAYIDITGTNPSAPDFVWNYLQFSGVVSTLVRGTVSVNYTLTLRNATGSAVSPDAPPLTITLLTNSTNGYFLNATDGTTLITTVTIGAGSSQAQFKYIDYSGGTRTVLAAFAPNATSVATAITITGTNPTFPFIEPPPYYLNFTTLVSSVAKDTATTTITVSLKNHTGALISPYSPPLMVHLVTNSTRGVFLNDTDGTTVINSVTIGTASNSANFKYKDGSGGATSMIMVFATNTTAAVTPITITGTPPSSGGAGDGIGPPPPYYLEFTTSNTTLLPGIASTTYTVTLKTTDGGAATSPVSPPLTITLDTNSTEGTFVNSTDGATAITTVTIGTASTSADFKYIEYRPGTRTVLTAKAVNTTPAAVVLSTENRGNLIAASGDSLASVKVNLIAVSQEDNGQANTRVGVNVLNPTPTDKTIDQVSIAASPSLATVYFRAIAMSSGSDVGWTTCLLAGNDSDTLSCNPTDFLIPAWSMRQVEFTYTTASTTTDGGTVLSATVTFASPAGTRSDNTTVMHEGTGFQVSLVARTATGGADRAGFPSLTGGSEFDFWFSFNLNAGSGQISTRLIFPPGWTNLHVPSQSALTFMGVSYRQPELDEPGYVFVGSGAATRELLVRATPPAISKGIYELKFELQGDGGTAVGFWNIGSFAVGVG